ncbi:hypothetical protein SEVIR_5G290200v4 [Setaria viridis]|uniref:Uncharacterized protein n=1 Tax=Setaria viridis TaxID=4556 RepID=A0A4U6ULA3_SETVI|nr:hypothetical protein SEVIR_5G290200v2 [Setaria viridis]
MLQSKKLKDILLAKSSKIITERSFTFHGAPNSGKTEFSSVHEVCFPKGKNGITNTKRRQPEKSELFRFSSTVSQHKQGLTTWQYMLHCLQFVNYIFTCVLQGSGGALN